MFETMNYIKILSDKETEKDVINLTERLAHVTSYTQSYWIDYILKKILSGETLDTVIQNLKREYSLLEKPCPFCGSYDTEVTMSLTSGSSYIHETEVSVYCTGCNMQFIYNTYGMQSDKFIDVWNRRV